jgi:hypothetical protein
MKNYENEKSPHLALALMRATHKGDVKISKEFANDLLGEFNFTYSKAYPPTIVQQPLSGSADATPKSCPDFEDLQPCKHGYRRKCGASCHMVDGA